jgi:hypothetical protein
MSVALNGNLKDFGIAEVFQLIGQQRKTGLLEIEGQAQTMQLAFDDGAIVWASPVGTSEFSVLGDRLVRCGLITRESLEEWMRESDASARTLPVVLDESGAVAKADLDEISDLLSRETLFEVMRWALGSFHFSAQKIHHDVPPEKLLAAEQILMDGLRMVDEWQTFKDNVPTDDTNFQKAGSFDAYRQQVAGSGHHDVSNLDRIHQLIDGRLTARRIIDLSRMGTFDATSVLAGMCRAGVIEALDAKSVRAITRHETDSVPVGRYLGRGLVAAIPVVLLAVLVQFGILQRPFVPEPSGLPIVRHPLEDARASFERRRLHNAIETSRLLRGEWPENLSEGHPASDDEAFALAPDPGRAYYYATRGDGILLLSPKR